MNEPRISIVMPVYNVEKYIENSIKSVLSQTFKEFELIIINDGSTDKSGDICDYYKFKDNRVTVIHKENSGSSDSRNLGIRRAKGEYICFIDSDDWIESNMLLETYDISEKYNCDIVINGISIDKSNEMETLSSVINNYEFSVWDTQDKIKNNIIELFPNALINSSCNKLYRLELIKTHNIKFPETNIGEDTLFNLDAIKFSKSIVVNDTSYYHYMRYENNKTLTNRIYEDAYERYIEIHNKMNDLFTDWNINNTYIEDKINQTMFCQYFATTMKIIHADKNIYSYKSKKKILDYGLKNKIIKNTFDKSEAFSYKEKIFRFIVKKRLYLLTKLLLTIKG